MRFLWATRGFAWGFRFLEDAGLQDPLPVYLDAFAGLDGVGAVVRVTGNVTAVRFPDPEGRTDRFGRIIPHDFVILPDADDAPDAAATTLGEAQELLWPLVAERYAATYGGPDSAG